MTKHLGTLVDPWFQPWSYFNEPSLLLLAATFLLLSKWWSNAISLSLSGYVLANGTLLINKTGWSQWLVDLDNDWQYLRETQGDILKEWEVQLILALIILSATISYSMRDIINKKDIQGELL